MPRVNKNKRAICKDIVEENGGSIKEIEEVVESQFEFLKGVMEEGAFSQVRFPYLGKFYVKPGRLSYINHASISRRRV
jgi:nucleoid DNA-binding protein